MTTKLSADDPASVFPNEQPHYRGLERAVNRSWRLTQRAFTTLRRKWFEAVALTDPAKDASEMDLTAGQKRSMDRAIEEFLRSFAGQDRSAEGYADQASEDGILQQSVYLAHSVGVARGREMVSPTQPNPAFTAGERRRLLEESFQRLSADGRLRFEGRLGEIRDGMVQAVNSGASPLAVARELGHDLDGYEQGRLRTLVRTEMATASEGAIQGTLAAANVQQYDVIGDPTTDETCVNEQEGGPYQVGDTDHQPPFHPNCFCSAVAHDPSDD